MIISIIVPVFNVSAYVSRCIKSVLNQTYRKLEVILIDDGSTDNSSEICKEYAKIDDRIRFISQSNSGLSVTRNRGIDLATGQYILFLDSDDYLAQDALENLVKYLGNTEPDLITSTFVWKVSESGEQSKYRKLNASSFSRMTGIDFLVMCIKQKAYTPMAPQFLYRRLFLNEANFRFADGLYHEDELWTPEVLLKANSVVIIDNPFYCYYTREGSITNANLTEKRATDYFKIAQKLNELYRTIPDSKFRSYLLDYVVRQKMLALAQLECVADLYKMKRHNRKKLIKDTIRVTEISRVSTFAKFFLFKFFPTLYRQFNPVIRATFRGNCP